MFGGKGFFSNIFSNPLTKKVIGSIGTTLIDSFAPGLIRKPLQDVLNTYTEESKPATYSMDVEAPTKSVYRTLPAVGRAQPRRASRPAQRSKKPGRPRNDIDVDNFDVDDNIYNRPTKRVKYNSNIKPDFLL